MEIEIEDPKLPPGTGNKLPQFFSGYGQFYAKICWIIYCRTVLCTDYYSLYQPISKDK